MTLKVLLRFATRHHLQVGLPREYPQATLLKDTLPRHAVGAYLQGWGGQALTDASLDDISERAKKYEEMSKEVASTLVLVVWPLSCARAAFDMAYVMLRCMELFLGQCWSLSQLTPVQRSWPDS